MTSVEAIEHRRTRSELEVFGRQRVQVSGAVNQNRKPIEAERQLGTYLWCAVLQ